VLNTISLEFVGISGAEDFVTSDLRSYDLHDNIAVGESDDETVFWRIVLVLGLGDKSLTCVVIFGLVSVVYCRRLRRKHESARAHVLWNQSATSSQTPFFSQMETTNRSFRHVCGHTWSGNDCSRPSS